MKSSKIIMLILSAALFAQCGYRPSEAAKTSLLVVYVTGSAFVVPQGKPEVPAAVGMIVRENDVIRTESGSVDLQTVRGNAIRVREMTTMSVQAIRAKGETRLGIKNGAILAKVQKASQEESFVIATPTAVAGVRGTTFSVEIGADSRSAVRVIDGKVSLSPRISALENKTPEQIQADPLLKKLAEIQAKQAVIEDRMQGRLNPELEKQILQAQETQKPEVITSEKSAEAEKVEIPVRELVESRTLVAVKAELIDKAIRGEAQAEKEIMDQREIAKERALDVIMKEVSNFEMKSEEEIRKRYARFELITLNSGEQIRGAVIAQTDSSLLVHTTSGVRKIPRVELMYQEPL